MSKKNNSTATDIATVELRDVTSADDIASIQDRVIEPVDVPEWGLRVYVKSLSAREKEKYVDSIRVTKGKGRNATQEVVLEESSAKLVVMCACDKNGKKLFNMSHVKMLADKSGKAMQRLVDKASELNGLSDDAEEDAKNDLASGEASDGSNID